MPDPMNEQHAAAATDPTDVIQQLNAQQWLSITSYLDSTDVAHLAQCSRTLHHQFTAESLYPQAYATLTKSNLNSSTVSKVCQLLSDKRTPLHSGVTRLHLEFGTYNDRDLQQVLQSLSSKTQLTELNINSCHQLTDACASAITTYGQSLTSLHCFWNVQFTDRFVTAIRQSSACSKLQRINFSGLKHITDDAVAPLISACSSNLRYLDLTRCISLTDNTLKVIGSSCSNLHTLLLYAASKWTDEGISALGQSCQQLRVLDLTGSPALTDQSMEKLTAGCPLIHTLILTWCIRLADGSLRAISKNLRCLNNLSIHGCQLMTDAGLDELARGSGKHLQRIDVNGLPKVTRKKLPVLKELFARLESVASL